MRKLYIGLLVLLCVLFAACGNNEENSSADGSNGAYDISHKENKDGSVTLKVNGQWPEDQAWLFVNFDESQLLINEVEQEKGKVEYKLIPGEAPIPYQVIEFRLCDIDSEATIANIYVTLEYAAENKGFLVDSVEQRAFDLDMDVEYTETEDMEDVIILSSEEIALLEQEMDKEAAEEASQQQNQSQQEKQESQKAKEFIWSHIAEVKFPEDILLFSAEKPTRLPGRLEAVSFQFEYEGERYSCLVSNTTPLSKFQTAFEIDREKAVEKEINGIVTYQFLEEKSARYLMWKDNAGVLYFIMDENQENVLDEIAALFLR